MQKNTVLRPVEKSDCFNYFLSNGHFCSTLAVFVQKNVFPNPKLGDFSLISLSLAVFCDALLR